MGSVSAEDRLLYADALVNNFPEPAADLIVEQVEHIKVEERLRRSCTRNRTDIHSLIRKEKESRGHSENRPASFAPAIRHTRGRSSASDQTPPNLAAIGSPRPASPPQSVTSSQKSSRSKASHLTVLVFDMHTEGEQPLQMAIAPIPHSFIKQSVALKRLNLQADPCDAPGGFITAQYGENFNSVLKAREQVTLYWRRCNVNTSHQTTFYVDISGCIDADLVLGEKDSGEGMQSNNASLNDIVPPGYARPFNHVPVQAPHLQQGRTGLANAGPSFHGSAIQPVITQYLSRQDEFERNVESQVPTHGMPPQPYRENTRNRAPSDAHIMHPTSGSNPAPGMPTTEELNVMYIYEKTQAPGKLKMNMQAEHLFSSIPQRIRRRIDRSIDEVRFTFDPENDSGDEMSLTLKESDSNVNWKELAKWIAATEASKKYLYAIVERGTPE